MADLIDEVPEAYLQTHRLDSIVWLPTAEIRGEPYDPAMVAVASLNNFVWLIRAAARGSEQADSWREYKVGSAILGYNFDDGILGITVGFNIKPQEGEGLNIHAEQMAVAKARLHRLTHIFGIAVWGDETDLDANPSHAPTLRPCKRCSGMFDECDAIKENTLILSGNKGLSTCEIYTKKQLVEHYEQGTSISDIPLYSLAEDMDDKYYTEQVLIPHLLPMVARLYPNSRIAGRA